MNLLQIMAISVSSMTASPATAQSGQIDVYHEDLGGGAIRFSADNPHPAPYQLEVTFPELGALQSDHEIPFRTVLAPETSRRLLFILRGTGRPGEISFRYRFRYAVGDPAAVHDDAFRYLFPFAHGTKHRLVQGNLGGSTHRGVHALDFAMEVGTPVTAARSGRVTAVKQDSAGGGPDPAFTGKGNYVEILHDDGTFARYVHLRRGGSRVRLGQHVRAGEVVGSSGNTGRSSGPHLHFSVHKAAPLGQKAEVTVPVRFRGREGTRVEPEEGLWYYAFHPGGRHFPVELGQEIRDADYARYREAVAADGKVRIVSRRVDDTVLLFARNGFRVAKTLTLTLTGAVNIRPSRRSPLTTTLPPTSEVFLLLIRPKVPHGEWSYGYTYSY